MVVADKIKEYFKLTEKINELIGDEEKAKLVSAVVVFNGERGVFDIGGKLIEVGDNVKLVSEEPERIYKEDGEGFIIFEDGEPVGFTMPPEEVVIADYSLTNFKLSLRFRYESVNGKPVLRFADRRPSLIGRVVFYNELSGWKIGRIEDITSMETDNYIIVGVPVIDGEPKVVPFIPVTAFGYPNNEEVALALLKNDYEALKREYGTRDNLENLSEVEGYYIVSLERVMNYRDELLLWDIAEGVIFLPSYGRS